MTISLPLSVEEEARLAALAAGQGVSPNAFVKGVLEQILSPAKAPSREEWRPEDRAQRLDELFAAFDSATPSGDIREEAFHRENWYR